MTIVSRYAPAPTGFLHLGHVVSAIYVWGLARAARGQVLLRIEDHDRQRSRREYEGAILEDLEWLGFTPDRPSFHAFRAGRCVGRQSDRGEIYSRALQLLREQNLIYSCECSRRDWAADERPGSEARYPGTCAHKNLPDRPGVGLRMRMDAGEERFTDLRHGVLTQNPAAQCGDVLIRDRDGNWTYQFAVAVDDWEQGINLVVRGEDLLQSTGRQIRIARQLGRTDAALFLHHPLVMRTATEKLSKANGDVGVRDLRARGWSREQVLGKAAALVGLAASDEAVTADEVCALVPEIADLKLRARSD